MKEGELDRWSFVVICGVVARYWRAAISTTFELKSARPSGELNTNTPHSEIVSAATLVEFSRTC